MKLIQISFSTETLMNVRNEEYLIVTNERPQEKNKNDVYINKVQKKTTQEKPAPTRDIK